MMRVFCIFNFIYCICTSVDSHVHLVSRRAVHDSKLSLQDCTQICLLSTARQTETRDCTQEGQCPFSDTGHPMAYAGLDGHGNYFTPSPLYVYEYVAGNVTKSVTIENLGES